MVARQQGYGIIIDDIHIIDWWEATSIIFWYIVYVYPVMEVPKALEEDIPMWVYGVGPTPGF